MNPNLNQLVRGLANDGLPGVGIIVNSILLDADRCWVENQAFGFAPWHIYVMRRYSYFISELRLQSGLMSKLETAWNMHSGML